MFGYFRFLRQYSDFQAATAYKNYYCGLCFALNLHYGPLSRMLLSYDTTILSVAMHTHLTPQCDKIRCVGCNQDKTKLFGGENWKKVAAVNILLAAEKLRDDVEDEKSLKAAVGSLVFRRCIRKAKKDYPQIHNAIRSGYEKIMDAEKENQGVLEIADCFGSMMTDVLMAAFPADETLRLYIREISRWLYFIDALDDYDEDVKKKRFNPLVQEGLSYREYVSTCYQQINKLLTELYANHKKLAKDLDDGSVESDILISILQNSIPAVTAIVLSNRKLPSLLHFKPGTVWRVKV